MIMHLSKFTFQNNNQINSFFIIGSFAPGNSMIRYIRGGGGGGGGVLKFFPYT